MLTEPPSTYRAPPHLSLLPHLDDRALNRVQRTGFAPFAADVWSFGVQLFVARAGRLPWTAAAATCKYFRAFLRSTQPHVLDDDLALPESTLWDGSLTESLRSDGSDSGEWQWPAGFSPALVHLLGACLRFREEERPSMSQIAKHQWFLNPQWSPPPQGDGDAPPILSLPSLSAQQGVSSMRTSSSEDAASSSGDEQSCTSNSSVPIVRTNTLPAITGTPRGCSGTQQGDGTSGDRNTIAPILSSAETAPRRRCVQWAPSPRGALQSFRYVSAEDTDPA